MHCKTFLVSYSRRTCLLSLHRFRYDGHSLQTEGKIVQTTVYRKIYTLFFYLLVPVLVLRMLWRALRAPAYAKRIGERFGGIEVAPQFQGGLWLHAVSVGEFNAAVPLIKRIQALYPQLAIAITTTTPTGSVRVKTVFGHSVFHAYAPYDLPHSVDRFLDRLQPKYVVIMETELWPNLLAACHKRQCPVIIANARLSEQSAHAYHKFYTLTHDMLNKITTIAAQTEADAQRFKSFNIPADKVVITGNLKFNQEIPQSISEIASQLRARWDSNRPVWVAASTHEGEEEQVLQAQREILQVLPNAMLILVPRHPERFAKVTALARKLGFVTASRSADDVTRHAQVLIGDTMGELTMFYAASDLAFVAGSLARIGGHNLLEPAALGIASLTGPYYFNMKTVTDLLIQEGATRKIHDAKALATTVIELLQDSRVRQAMGEKGLSLVQRNRSAVAQHMAVLQAIFGLPL